MSGTGRNARPRARRLPGAPMVLALAMAAFVMGCALPNVPAAPTAVPCAVEAAAFVAAAQSALAEWDAVEAQARVASGGTLGAAIADLQRVHDAFRALEPPECAVPAKVAISRYMALTIDVHNAYLMNDCRVCTEETEHQAGAARAEALEALEALRPAP